MNIRRIIKHLTMTDWQIKQAFTETTRIAIEESIKASEAAHAGQIRFVVEGALDCAPLFKHQSSKERAIDVFAQLRIWDTEHNNGLLVYLLFADRAVEIVADRGIHAKVGTQEWQSICRRMESDFKQANYKDGVLTGIDAMTQLLKKHFPASDDRSNELSDKPVVL